MNGKGYRSDSSADEQVTEERNVGKKWKRQLWEGIKSMKEGEKAEHEEREIQGAP